MYRFQSGVYACKNICNVVCALHVYWCEETSFLIFVCCQESPMHDNKSDSNSDRVKWQKRDRQKKKKRKIKRKRWVENIEIKSIEKEWRCMKFNRGKNSCLSNKSFKCSLSVVPWIISPTIVLVIILLLQIGVLQLLRQQWSNERIANRERTCQR